MALGLRYGAGAAEGTALKLCRSSVVEHSLGKGEVHSSILCGSTSSILRSFAAASK